MNRPVLTWLHCILICLGCFGSLAAAAQQELGVTIHVNRTPQGTYPTKIYQFTSMPGLITVMITNHTGNNYTIFLNGSVTGDNGVHVTTAKGYQPASLTIKPYETKTLNAVEAGNLFDFNNLVYLSGNTSIKPSVFGEQGLPEGTYQICIRAYDAATRRALSDEEPLGCSNAFTITTLEPPSILSPVNGDSVMALDPQNVTMRWTTPPGAPPSTQYRILIYEVLSDYYKANNTLLSSATPFFDFTVQGTPMLLYSPQFPRMQKGRTYAMAVIASDPAGNASFRNRGRSEVIQFTYGGNGAGGLFGGIAASMPEQEPSYTTNTLNGRLSWTFKKTEQGSYTITDGSRINEVQAAPSAAATKVPASPTLVGAPAKSPAGPASSLASSALSLTSPAFSSQARLTPLINYNVQQAVNKDNTLGNLNMVTINGIIDNIGGKPAQPSLPANIVSVNGASNTEITYETIAVDSAAERYPLANVNITLSAISKLNGASTLLATGRSDAQGNFSIRFLDPSYQHINDYSGLSLSVQTSDFENTSFPVPVSLFRNSRKADAGNFLLLAKTYRLFPDVSFEDSPEPDAIKKYVFHLYREADEIKDRPYLLYEGQTTAEKKGISDFQNKKVIEIGVDSMTVTSPSGPGRLVASSLFARALGKGVGKLFFGGNLYVSIEPVSIYYAKRSFQVSAVNAPIPSNQVLKVKAGYKLELQPSHVEGHVQLLMAGQNSIPIPGAIVRVMYRKTDAIPSNTPYIATRVTSPVTLHESSGQPSVPTGGQASMKTLNAGNLNTKSLYSYALAGAPIAPPLLVQETKPAGGHGTISAQPALDPTLIADLHPMPPDSDGVTVTTDETGYYIANYLPALKDGSKYTVEVISVPAEFRTFDIHWVANSEYPAVFSLSKGRSKLVDFRIDADVADVVGRVVDDQGKPLQYARVNFKGNTVTSTGLDGIFAFKIYPGNHVLTLEKEGYVVKQTTISIPQLTGKQKTDNNQYLAKWSDYSAVQQQQATLERISRTPTVQASIARGNAFSPQMFGFAAPSTVVPGSGVPGAATEVTAYNGSFAKAFGLAANLPSLQYEAPREFAVDLRDVGYLNKIVGKARFRVMDEDTRATIPGAAITLFDTTHATDGSGEWYYEGLGGNTVITIIPPAGSTYIPQQATFALAETGVEQVIPIYLKKGVAITGRVTGGGQALSSARVLLDDKDLGSVITASDGRYTLYVAAGEHTISARKQNYIGQDITRTIPSSGATIDFNLKGGNAKKYGTLLGFAIELSSAEPVGNNQEKWSGSFVNLQPADRKAFSTAADTRLPFSNLIVSFAADGTPMPRDNMVKTDVTELSLKLFGYLPVTLTGDKQVITVDKGVSFGDGVVGARLNAGFGIIQGYRGWGIGGNVPLAPVDSPSSYRMIVFSSGQKQPASVDRYTLVPPGGKLSGQLYGFAMTLSKGAVVDNNGIELTGTISTPDLGAVRPISIEMSRLYLNRALVISGLQVQADHFPGLEIAGWKAAVNTLAFNEDGFRLDGDLAVTIPASGTSQISFAGLSIAKDGIFGGSFALPESGIGILSASHLRSAGTPLVFGRVGNSSVYRIGGKADFKIDVPILQKSFDVPLFEIMTNGEFTVMVPVGYSTNIGPFGFSVGNLVINAKENDPYIGIQGAFRADLDFLKFEAADIKVRSSPGGPTFTIGRLGVKLDVPVVQTQAQVNFDKDGFAGDGTLNIPGTPIHGSIGFRYFKHPEGVELAANFSANIPPLPIGGGLVTLERVGGGFKYISGGANGGFTVDVNGKLGFLGTGAAVALDPIGITVSSAGILKGYGDVTVASYLKTAHAEAVFNGPEQTFTVQVSASMSPLEGLVEQNMKGTLVISGKPGDEYAFLGCAVDIKLLGLIDNHGEVGIAVGLKNPKTRGDLVSHYFAYAPEEYMRETFSGVYINAAAQMGIPKDDPLGFDLYVASARLWFSSAFQAGLLLNFSEGAYRIRFGGKFDAGAKLSVLALSAELSAGLCYLVDGGRSPELGWNFGASATGDFSAYLGAGHCDVGCNEIGANMMPPWKACAGARVCGAASLDFHFSERDKLHFSARAGGDTTPCF
jgi:hypothetical protein